jgi:photosystem II stability/assembly factor-like uncharacterized protein
LLGAGASSIASVGPNADRPGWTVLDTGVTDDLYMVRFVNRDVGWAVGAHSTILHTKDGGKTWARQIPRDQDGYRFENITIAGPKVAYVRTSLLEKILRTTDGGATWVNVPLPARFIHFQHAAVGSSYYVAYGADTEVRRTDDGGRTWTRLTDVKRVLTNYGSMSFPDKNTGCIVSGRGFVAVTADGAKTWSKQTIEVEPSEYMVTQFVDAKNGFIVPHVGNVHRSTDGGKSWQKLKLAASPGQDLHFLNAEVGHVLHGRMGMNVSRTTDGGETWQQLDDRPAFAGLVRSLSFPTAASGVVVGDKGYIARYTNK